MKLIERADLHATFVSFEAMDRGIRDFGAVGEDANADSQGRTRHSNLSGIDHF
ncbi:MAG: hypothetical protein ABII76_08955 [Pseudomonadota bacterium]